MHRMLVILFGLVAATTAAFQDYPFLREGYMCATDFQWQNFRVYFYEFDENVEEYFKLSCPYRNYFCEWYHEEHRIPRYYGSWAEVTDMYDLRLQRRTSNSGTWRVRYGNYENVYHVAVKPSGYEDWSDDWSDDFSTREDSYQYDYYMFDGNTFENKYFYNRVVRHSYFKDVTFRDMHFHFVRFENVTFEDVKFEWTEELYTRAEFVNCRFVNTMFVRAYMRHSMFRDCYFEGGWTWEGADERYRNYLHTFVRFNMYDTLFCNVRWSNTFWYYGEAHNMTFNFNRFNRFRLFETWFYSFYEKRIPCRDITYGDYVRRWEEYNSECFAYVFSRRADQQFHYRYSYYAGYEYDWWFPSVHFWNSYFDDFTFWYPHWHAVDFYSTQFDGGYFYGENNGYFRDTHWAACKFFRTSFNRFYFRGFTYFTGCYFFNHAFDSAYGEWMYFYGCSHYYFNMNFTQCKYMYFDYSFWHYGYVRGFYDRYRVEYTGHRSISWEVNRVARYEYCGAYYDNWRVKQANIDSYENFCSESEGRWLYSFCENNPYHYWCLHYRPYSWRYCSDDMYYCNYETPTWWSYTWWWRYHWQYPSTDYDHKEGNYNVGRWYGFDARMCWYERERFDWWPYLFMRDFHFEQDDDNFLGFDSSSGFYYEWNWNGGDEYWTTRYAFDRMYFLWEKYFHCFW